MGGGGGAPHRDVDDLSTGANIAIHVLIIGSLVVAIAIAVSCADAKGRLQWHALNYRWRAYLRGSGAGPAYAQVGSAAGGGRVKASSSSSGVHKFTSGGGSGKLKPGGAARSGTRRERARLAPAEEVDDDEEEDDEEVEVPVARAPRRSGRTAPPARVNKAGRAAKPAAKSRKATPLARAPSLDSDESD